MARQKKTKTQRANTNSTRISENSHDVLASEMVSTLKNEAKNESKAKAKINLDAEETFGPDYMINNYPDILSHDYDEADEYYETKQADMVNARKYYEKYITKFLYLKILFTSVDKIQIAIMSLTMVARDKFLIETVHNPFGDIEYSGKKSNATKNSNSQAAALAGLAKTQALVNQMLKQFGAYPAARAAIIKEVAIIKTYDVEDDETLEANNENPELTDFQGRMKQAG